MPRGNRGQGRQRGGREGGPKKCVCPECGHEEEHKRGQPCSSQTCPECGTRMIGKW